MPYDDDNDGIATEQPVDEADLRKKLNSLSIVLGKRLDSLPPRVPAPRSVPLATPTVEPPGGAGPSLGDQPAAVRPPSLLNAVRRQPARPDVMPTRADFPTKPLPTWQKVLGVAAAPFLPNLTTNILGRPQREAEQQYQRAYQEYKRPLDIAQERATTAKTQADTEEALARATEARAQAAAATQKPIDETKQPIGDAGATQHAKQLETLTGGMSPIQKKQFLDAYTALPTDTHAIATKRFEDGKAAAQLSSGERDRAVQLQIAQKRQQEEEADRAERRSEKREETGGEIWRAVDKQNRVHLIPRSEYDANKGNYPSAMKLNPDALKEATNHATAINEMQARTNAMADAGQKFNWADSGQKSIVKQALAHSNDQNYVDQILGIPVAQWTAANVKQWGLEGATPETRDYIIAALSLREASLAMPKEITGGSRSTQQAVSALWNTLPEGATPNSNWMMAQLRANQSIIDRIKRTRVPAVPGLPEEPVHPALAQGGTHNFTVNGVAYTGVSDEDYARAKKLKGFKE